MRIVISGATAAGVELARVLSEEGNEVVLIDKDQDRLREAEEHLDVMTLLGDPTRRSVLERAQVAGARGFVALSNGDNDNVLAAALAKSLGARVTVARMDAPDFYLNKGSLEMDLIGVDMLLCATRLATVELIDSIMATHLPFLGTFANAAIRVGLVPVGERSDIIGKAAADTTFDKKVRTVAVVSDGYLRPVERVSSVERGDRLLVVGAAGDFPSLWRRAVPGHIEDRALIAGGGDIGTNLAVILSAHIPRVEVVEKDPVQAMQIATNAERATVFVGDARSATFLQDQQIDTVSYLLAVTGDDEVNLLISLLGRKLGVAHPIVLLHRPGYAELYTELGISSTVALFDLVARSARHAISPYGLVQYKALTQTGYVVSEWRLPPHPAALASRGMTFSDIPLPEDAHIIGLARGTTAISLSGDLKLEGRETLILLSPEESLDRIHVAFKKLIQEKSP